LLRNEATNSETYLVLLKLEVKNDKLHFHCTIWPRK